MRSVVAPRFCYCANGDSHLSGPLWLRAGVRDRVRVSVGVWRLLAITGLNHAGVQICRNYGFCL